MTNLLVSRQLYDAPMRSTPLPVPPMNPNKPWTRHPGITSINNMLEVDDNKLYIAYGEYSGGNHKLLYIDLETGLPGEGITIPSEGMHTVRKINGHLYFSWQDPMGAWGANQGYTTNESGTWENKFLVPAVHFYDVFEHGGDMWMIGSMMDPTNPDQSAATVWRSEDNGATWGVSLIVSPRDDGASHGRVYNAYAANGKIVVKTQHIGSGEPGEGAWEFDGTDWSRRPDLDSVLPSYFHSFNTFYLPNGTFFPLGFWNGTTVQQIRNTSNSVIPFTPKCIYDGYVYGMSGTSIYRANGATGAELVQTLPLFSVDTMARDENFFYMTSMNDLTGIWRQPIA